ncbi:MULTISPECIES: type II toxin-antitoxin system BrnA family antitoxin [Cyanophyceae]|uniref:BrnA antitoxin family protein n=1 Tax=Leptolyngbya subtilissima DQ-A4 TaxID=2933933 RepID=A0ABV0K0I5_9CYAN|nr:CopG family transcriptional regulator [Nodosilinea sp. FACHB-141]MBD2111067.1 CopG family transcriptional regulator [Nodosilinea sp. FACHB-141]
MNAEDLDCKFDDGEDVLEYFDLSTLKRPGLEPQSIEITFPQWMVAALDKEAQRLGIQREAIIKLWLAERLDANPVLGA